MSSPSPIPVIFASDARGLMPLTVSLWTLLETAKPDTVYDIRILNDGITPETQQELKAKLAPLGERHSIRFMEVVDALAANLRENMEKWTCTALPRSAWSRIFAPQLMPEIDRAIYLDIDIVVCDDLTSLYETDMKGAAIGGVLERRSAPDSHFNKRLEMPLECEGYFNSGILLLDFAQFRRDHLSEAVMEFAHAHPDVLEAPDQDALNGTLCMKTIPLHPRWNWHDGLARRILKANPDAEFWRGNTPRDTVEAAMHPGVMHFLGPHKPWRYNFRMYGPVYEAAMRRAGFGDMFPLPGWKLGACLRRFFYQPLYALTRWRIRRLARRWNIT